MSQDQLDDLLVSLLKDAVGEGVGFPLPRRKIDVALICTLSASFGVNTAACLLGHLEVWTAPIALAILIPLHGRRRRLYTEDGVLLTPRLGARVRTNAAELIAEGYDLGKLAHNLADQAVKTRVEAQGVLVDVKHAASIVALSKQHPFKG